MPAVDLRELVKAPIELTGAFATPANSHPVHDGINLNKQYTSSSAAPIALPRGGRGLERLKISIHDPVSGMDAERSLESHVKLLSEAPFHHTMPGTALFGPEGETLEGELAARTRGILFTAVFRDPDEKFDGHSFSAPRIGAVGTLTVLPDPNDKRRVEDAWLGVQWVRSSSSMLDALLRVSGLHLEVPSVHRRIEILIAEDLATEQPSLLEQVSRLAMMLGGNPQIHVVTHAEWGKSAMKVRANNPFELVVLGSGVHESVVSEFTSRHGERNLHRANVKTADAAISWLLDFLPHIMGVTPALMSYPQTEVAAGRPRMPVRWPAKCLHHRDNRYVLDGDTDQWWTRDFAQHGSTEKTIFKTYEMISGNLFWASDRSGDGTVIADKHKGPKGERILLSETGSCAHPASHLH